MTTATCAPSRTFSHTSSSEMDPYLIVKARRSLPALSSNNYNERNQPEQRARLRRSIPVEGHRYEEPSMVNATWHCYHNYCCGKRRSRKTQQFHHDHDALHSPTKYASSASSQALSSKHAGLIIDTEELNALTAMLWTTDFIGTVDPRFHAEYLECPEDSLFAKCRGYYSSSVQ